MSNGAATTLWAQAFCDELARAGVREVVVAPGSRSTPLVMAFAADDRFRCRVHLDERSAAFFALGVGKASGRPAVVVTTSGTAAANVFPAVIEAAQGETPLLVLTADRPHHLRDADANQAIDQIHLYGSFTRAFFEVAQPILHEPAFAHLRALAGRAVAEASGSPRGPVHLNFPFDKPLEPVLGAEPFRTEHQLAGAGRDDGVPLVQVDVGRREASPEALEALVAAVATPRGVIVAGPTTEGARLGEAVWALAGATGFPVMADALSGARFGPSGDAHVVAAYDLFLRDDNVRDSLTPTLIVRVGASPTSAALQGWMKHHGGVRHVVVDGGSRWKDHGALATEYVQADAADTLASVAELAPMSTDPEWQASWRTAEAAALAVLSGDVEHRHEGHVAGIVAATLPQDGTLFVSSSMPVRDLDAFGHPHAEGITVLGNRGASGIDGIVSTAFGVAAASDGPTVCLLGDVAFFHDQNGLLWSREKDAAVIFVLIDNDGGGIFHMLPIAAHEPGFTRFFATPHGLDFRHVAEMHDVPFQDAEVESFSQHLDEAIALRRSCVLRIRTSREENTRHRREVTDAVSRSVREALARSLDLHTKPILMK